MAGSAGCPARGSVVMMVSSAPRGRLPRGPGSGVGPPSSLGGNPTEVGCSPLPKASRVPGQRNPWRSGDVIASTRGRAMSRSCFVIMGFGKKTDFATGRVLDLDKSYRNVIKPAVQEAGLECVRADEITHSGVIDVPMYRQLLDADV